MGNGTKGTKRGDRPPTACVARTPWWRRFRARARPVDDKTERATTALCRQLIEHAAKDRHTLADAFCALGCAKVLLVEPGDTDALHPWHFYMGPRRPALLHLGGSVHSTRALLEEDGPSHLVVAGETNRDERFRVILSMDAKGVAMTAKIYRAPRCRPFGPPIACTVRVHPTPR